MTAQGKFDDKAKVGFLKLLAKEAQQDIELDEQQWSDWIQILRDLACSPDVLISSDALKVLTAIYASHPDRMAEETPQSVQEYRLGKLVATKAPQDQDNLINYIFTVMLNNDRAIREDMQEMKETMGNN